VTAADPTSGLLAADARGRELAQTEFERPLVLEAGAGTGKTTTLVARVLAWCLGPGWRKNREAHPDHGPDRLAARVLSRVVALTFTEAAAAEMASRVGQTLARVAAGEPPLWLTVPEDPPDPGAQPGLFDHQAEELAQEQQRGRARHLLGALERLRVATIHAWCLEILTEHPLEAGLAPQLTVDADQRRLQQAALEAVESRLRTVYGDPPDPHYIALARAGCGPADLVRAVVQLHSTGAGSRDLDADPLGEAPVNALLDRLSGHLDDLHRLVAPRLAGASGSLRKALETEEVVGRLLGEIRDVAARVPGERLPLVQGAVARARDEISSRLKKWSRADYTKAEGDALEDVRPAVAEAAGRLDALMRHVAGLDAELLHHARVVLRDVLRDVEGRLARRGVIGYQGLLQQAADLVHREDRIAGLLRRSMDQFLVDEFQDTDRLQCRLLAAVALGGSARERPGLFLVGDPKQSIYGWRSADLAAYEDFVGRLLDLGGVRQPLVRNFRSVPPVLDEVTRLVEPVMHPEARHQPPFEPLEPRDDLRHHPGFTDGDRGPVEHWISWRSEDAARAGEGCLDKTGSTAADEIEARAIAADVADLHRRHGVPLRSVALLFRAATSMEIYLRELRAAGLQYEVSDDREFYRRREVIEAAALVRAVLDPGDHLALLTLLRSVMVGVPDAALIPLWLQEIPRRATELTGDPGEDAPKLTEIRAAVAAARAETPRDVPGLDRLGDWTLPLIAAFETLAALRRSWRRDPVDRFVDRLRSAFLEEPVEAARYLGRYRLDHLDAFYRQLAGLLDESSGDVTAALHLLRRLLAGTDAETAVHPGVPQEGAEAIQVMTIHKAKGLEFDHVYLPQLHHGQRNQQGPDTVLERPTRPDGEPGHPEYRLLGAATPGFDLIEAAARRREAAERVRLLYVAATRAKVRLVTAACWPAAGDGMPVERAGAFLDLVRNRRGSGEAPRAVWERLEESGGSPWRDPDGVLWRGPDLVPATLPAPSDESETAPDDTPPTPDPVAVARADAETLARHRAAARRRVARPVSRAASEEAHRELRELAARAEPVAGDALPRETAMAVGTAVHRVLELYPLPEEKLTAVLDAALEPLVPPDALAAARTQARDLWRRFTAGPLAARLDALLPHVVARELAVLLPPDPEDADGPVGFLSGAIDLLYRDPDDGELVLADYKTDQVESPLEVDARARAYALQGRVYRRAVAEALGLSEGPRVEFWFVVPGLVVPVSAARQP
jgi:ATP-dependent helicase/nuclease subunit A